MKYIKSIALKLTTIISMSVLLVSIAPSAAQAAFPGSDGPVYYFSLASMEEGFSMSSINLNGSSESVVKAGLAASKDLTWSSGGNKMAWSGVVEGEQVSNIFIADHNGSNTFNLTNITDIEGPNGYGKGAQMPRFSPDGSKIIYAETFEFSDTACGLYIINTNGTGRQPVLEVEDECFFAPSFSPDGTRVAYFARDVLNEGTKTLYVMDANGTNQQPLVSGLHAHLDGVASVDWSPGGSQILFTDSNASPGMDETTIGVVSAEGGAPTYIRTFESEPVGEAGLYIKTYRFPQFTPSGRIIFSELEGTLTVTEEGVEFSGSASLKTMNSTGGGELTIQQFSADVTGEEQIGVSFNKYIYPAIRPLHVDPEPEASNEVTLSNAESGGLVTLQTPENTGITCSSSIKETAVTAQDAAYKYSLGLVEFCFDTEQEDNEVSLIFTTDLKPGQVVARKYNSVNQTFFDIEGASITETTHDGQPALQITYTITDNGQLDLDPTVGTIKDPVGLAIRDDAGSLAASGQSVFYVVIYGLMATGLLGGFMLTGFLRYKSR